MATTTRFARPVRDLSAAVTVIPRSEITLSPTLTTDSLVRTLPSVATFRRSSSLSADPSSQGLNLRGVGPSGASRTLVLLDGVPVNDPFAGSIYFRSLPRLGIDRVEVVPGGGSALYGSSALAGVMQIFSRDDAEPGLDADAAYGLANTAQLAARGALVMERARGSVEGEWLRSDGFRVVSEADRGVIDQRSESQHGNASARAAFAPSARWSIAPTLSVFRQTLRGATRYTDSGVSLGSASLRTRYDAARRGRVEFVTFARLTEFEQTRARVFDERASEALSGRQRVPASDQGGSLTWSSQDIGARRGHAVLAGVDVRHAQGHARERLFPAETTESAPRTRDAGGRQLLLGAFAQALVRPLDWFQVDGALRFDTVRHFAGYQSSATFAGTSARTDYTPRSDFALSPRLGVLFSPTDWLRVRASGYRAFRVPTLNELYRPFQVGTILTAANPGLAPEVLSGAELGLETTHFGALTLRTTGFWSALEDAVSNATLDAPLADGATRQRRNLPLARVRGAELSAELRLARRWSILLAYTAVDARVVKSGSSFGVTGKRLAQDPVHRASGLVFFDDPRLFSASLQVRVLGAQFEDDLNTLRMSAYAVVDALLARRIVGPLEGFVAVENLLDARYVVGRAGVDTVGTPLLARVGLRLRQLFRAGKPP